MKLIYFYEHSFIMGEDKQDIFLEDNSILPWERPLEEGHGSMLYAYDGSTKLVEQIKVGLDTINELVGPFRVIGSATKYLADIAHLSKHIFRNGESVSGEVKREILFSGGLSIYRNGQIPGTDIQGYYLERHGKIWIAKNPEEQFYGSDGLRNLVLGNDSNAVGRIESILHGYKTKEDREEEARIYLDICNVNSARRQGQMEGPVYRGAGPC